MLNKRILTLVFVVAFVTLLIGCLPAKNQAPVIISNPVKTGEVGVPYTYDVDATDPDGDTLTYTLDIKPTNMSISSTTGLINWIPATEGNFSVVVKVSDGDLDITQSFTIAVIGEEEPGVTPTPPKYHTITATAGDNGTIDPLGEVKVKKGSNKTFTITPDTNYSIADVLVDTNSVGAVGTYKFNNVTATHIIHATFNPVLLAGSYSYSWTTSIMDSTDFDFTVGMGWLGPFPWPPNVYYFFHPDETPPGYSEPIGGAWLFEDIDFDITSAGQTFSVTSVADDPGFAGFANLLTNGTDEVIWFGYMGDRDNIASAGGQKGIQESQVFSGTDVGTDFPGYVIKDISLTFDQIYLDSANANKLVLDFTIDIYVGLPTP